MEFGTDVQEASGIGQTTHSEAEAAHYRAKVWWRDRTHLDDFLDCVGRHPDKTAVVACSKGKSPVRLSYGELGARVERAAAVLLGMGIERGDIISIQLPNSWQFPVIAFAAMRVGAIPNPIPPIYRAHEVEFMVRHAKSKILVVPSEFRGFPHADLAKQISTKVDTLEKAIIVGGNASDDQIGFDELIEKYDRPVSSEISDKLEQRKPSADDPVVLLFTSGTTGTPKAAIHTHNTIWSAGQPIPEALNLSCDDVGFMASTVGHLTGFYWGTVLPLSMGQKLIYQDIWDPEAMLEMIETEGISWTLSATPFAMDLVEASKLKKRSLTSFRAFVCGGATIPPKVATEVQSELGVSLISLWGCTEMGICTIHKLGAPVEVLADSDGFVVDRMKLRIVDDDLQPVGEFDEGRLQVSGASVFAGYYRQPDMTDELRTADGWFDTGDIGRKTELGGIRISGRSKDIIIRGGQNIPVVEIENEIANITGVQDVAVVGVPDARLGEKGCVIIVTDGTQLSLDDVRHHLNTVGMAKQFWPEYLQIVEEMPRTPAGKIKKYELRDIAAKLVSR